MALYCGEMFPQHACLKGWRRTPGCVLALLFSGAGVSMAAAQTPAPALQPQTSQGGLKVTEQITVLGEPEPVKLGESARSGEVIEVAPLRLDVPEVADILRTDSSVDIEQRGGGGTQADVSIRGASFEQTLVLLNGLRINDVETSHFNLDLPVPLEGIRGLDVLHGAGSTLYGSDAIGGVVNVSTFVPTDDSIRLRAGVRSYGINTQSVLAGASGR